MAVIPLRPLEEIDDPRQLEMLEKARGLNVPDEQFFQVLTQAPGYAEALFDALYRSHASGIVDHKLKEIIRVQLARRAGDPYFASLRSSKALQAGLTEDDIEAGCGDFENDSRFSTAEKWALRYGYLMFREPQKVNREFYQEGKTHYSEAEIVELGAFIALHYGLQVFMRTLKLEPHPPRPEKPISTPR
ncbi:MAG: hypothetical protein V3S64_16245 [bacterium]